VYNLSYEQRLAAWSAFRESLETSADPLQDTIDFYKQFPLVSIHTDPYDKNCWPDPWELIHENEYCDYCIILGMCYTLQLTTRFSGEEFEIHIGIDEGNTQQFYLLVVGDKVLGYDVDTYVNKETALTKIKSQVVYPMTTDH